MSRAPWVGATRNKWTALPAAAALAGVIGVTACATGAGSGPGHVEHGQHLYAQQCASCHGDAATGRGAVPPAPNHGPEGHTWHHADGDLAGIILGRLDYPSRSMPSFAGKLTEADVAAVLAHIKAGWTEAQRTQQAELSRRWEAERRRP